MKLLQVVLVGLFVAVPAGSVLLAELNSPADSSSSYVDSRENYYANSLATPLSSSSEAQSLKSTPTITSVDSLEYLITIAADGTYQAEINQKYKVGTEDRSESNTVDNLKGFEYTNDFAGVLIHVPDGFPAAVARFSVVINIPAHTGGTTGMGASAFVPAALHQKATVINSRKIQFEATDIATSSPITFLARWPSNIIRTATSSPAFSVGQRIWITLLIVAILIWVITIPLYFYKRKDIEAYMKEMREMKRINKENKQKERDSM